MKYYFKKFAEQKINTESDEFCWLLYFVYCSLNDTEKSGGNLWDYLKDRIKDFNFNKRTISKVKIAALYLLRNLRTSSFSSNASFPVSKIKSLQAKNFRGFGSEFNGDDKGILVGFDSNNTIFYGPNGSGKSSLCDALEYKLTGLVREAMRRNRRVLEYVKRIGSSSNPSLELKFVNPAIDANRLSEEQKKYYSQAFIEKNRIQEFSLFGSKDTGIKKEEILSILIGMDDLSKLTNAFVQTAAFRTNLLTFKRSVISDQIVALNTANVRNITLKKNHEDVIEAEKVKADSILSKIGATITDLDEELVVIDHKIEATNADTLSLSSISVLSQTQNDFANAIQVLVGDLQKYDALKGELIAAKSDLDYSNLYTAIEELKSSVKDTCPACDTPISNVTRNPFTKASEEIVKLRGIKETEVNFNEQKILVEQNLKSLELFHKNLLLNIASSTVLGSFIADNTVLHSAFPELSLTKRELIDEYIIAINHQILHIDNYFSELDTLYQRQTQKLSRVNSNNEIIMDLNRRKNSIESIKMNWESAQTNLDAVILSLGTYTSNLANIYADKIIEDKYNLFIDSLIAIYPSFYNQLQTFKDTEFQSRFGKLETEIAGFYTQINKHDEEHDLVEYFKIDNTDSDYKIEFKIKDSPTLEDASIKFSEGHLRSLGLSILLANAKINKLPFIIFDDVVNAIDSDHRANIIEMMVNDSYLKDTQQIVSTHDRLYWERFSLENQKQQFLSFILKCSKSGVVHYHYDLSFKEKIQSALDHFDIRQALLYCRIWFETIAKQFCIESNIVLSGQLRNNGVNMSIEPSLGSMYRELLIRLPDNVHLKVLHTDEINYKGINQEHHSFDEYNFNFIHSRTSEEVQKIFNAVSGLDDDIRLIKDPESQLNHLLDDLKRNGKKIQSLNTKMPTDIQLKIIERHNDILKQLSGYPDRLRKLQIDEPLIKSKEDIIKKIQIGYLISGIIKYKCK